MTDKSILLLPLVAALPLAFLVIARAKGELYGRVLALLLLGYLLFGKGIAYLGVGPLYISELTLALGLGTVLILAMFTGRLEIGAVNHIGALILIVFMLWGAVRTLPFLSEYGLDALRDGVIWGYAVFAFCVALLIRPPMLERMFGYYSRSLPYVLPLVLFLILILPRLVNVPSLPDAPVPLIAVKAGDGGVHLAGIAAFLMLRLDRAYGRPYAQWQLWAMWALWGVLWILWGINSRGGMLSALMGPGIVLLLRPRLTGWVRPAVLVSILLAALLVGDLLGITEVSNAASRRQFSFQQISTNFTSVFGGESRFDQANTISWRFAWWRKIWDYTINGEYLMDGKGFGINLAAADGFGSLDEEVPNRHPHNITMNILARAGLPGFVLWLAFVFVFGARLLKATTRAGWSGKTAIWLLAYWLAFMFNAQFDVFLEGPMGGVWFWALVGASWVFIYRMPKWYRQPVLIAPTPYVVDQLTPYGST